MSLTIVRLLTRFHVPRQLGARWSPLGSIGHDRFATECSRQLSLRWPAGSEVIRIRRLRVRLNLSRADTDKEKFARGWARAFVEALFVALASPSAVGPVEIVRYDNRASWLARIITDLLSGEAHLRWEYEEFREFFDLPTADAVVALLSSEPTEMVPALIELDELGQMSRLLALFDELAMEKLFVAVSQVTTEAQLRVEDLLTLGHFVVGHTSLIAGALATRKTALRLFLAMTGQPSSAVWAPRQILHSLTTLVTLVEALHAAGPSRWARELSAETLRTRIGGQLSPAVSELFDEIRGLADSSPKNGAAVNIAALADLITDLKPLVASARDMDSEGRLLSSDCAGVLLLAAIVNRLRWPERIIGSVLGSACGQRAVTYCLAGIGQAVIGRFDEEPRSIDPGLALFSGWIDEADLGGLRHFFASASREDRRQLLSALLPQADSLDERSSSWAATLDFLADHVIREFANRVRGFKQSSRPFVVRNFLVLPGQIRVEDTRIAVTLASSPFHTALHLSGLDEPIENLSWLGGRRLEFQLEDL
jgi:hypothetical protein